MKKDCISSQIREAALAYIKEFNWRVGNLTSYPSTMHYNGIQSFTEQIASQIEQYRILFESDVGGIVKRMKSEPAIERETKIILESLYKAGLFDWKSERFPVFVGQIKKVENYFDKKFKGEFLPSDPLKKRMMIMEGAYQELQLERLKPHATEYTQ